MNQNLKRLLCQMCLDPVLLLTLAGYVPAFLLAFLTLSEGWLLVALIWAGLCALLGRMLRHGRPRGLSMSLTANFYAMRTFGGWWSIFQRPLAEARRADCKALLRSLAEEQCRLPAALPPGRYQALTHDTVLRRLKAMPSAELLTVTPVYRMSMERITCRMTGGRCRQCKRVCPFPRDWEWTRQFYCVRFEIHR